MALWSNTTKPKWLLPSGEGTNAVPNGDELALADDLPGIGWRIWHAKESGQALGVGRGFPQWLATQDVTGGAVDSAGPVAGIVSAISLSAAGVAAITGGAPLAFTVSATDEDNQVITYTAVSAINCTDSCISNYLIIFICSRNSKCQRSSTSNSSNTGCRQTNSRNYSSNWPS
jgi:hypothetical protein